MRLLGSWACPATINNKELPEEDTTKNDKGVTVVTRSGLIKLGRNLQKSFLKMNLLVMM